MESAASSRLSPGRPLEYSGDELDLLEVGAMAIPAGYGHIRYAACRLRMTRVALITLALLANGCGIVETFAGEVASDDGKLSACFFDLAGGGAAGWRAQYVSVGGAKGCSQKRSGVVARFDGANQMCLKWQPGGTLLIIHPHEADLREKMEVDRELAGFSVEARAASPTRSLKEQCPGTNLSLWARRTVPGSARRITIP